MTQKLDVIRELQRELVRKDSRLQTEKMKTKQLMEERSDEQRRYEAALKGEEILCSVYTRHKMNVDLSAHIHVPVMHVRNFISLV